MSQAVFIFGLLNLSLSNYEINESSKKKTPKGCIIPVDAMYRKAHINPYTTNKMLSKSSQKGFSASTVVENTEN